jgi:peptidoglycan/LPS O-acetylase OafA/YrhL
MHTIQAHLAGRRDNFLLLRIIAAVMVIYGHSFPLTRDLGTTDIFLQHGWRIYSGDIAVLMFFVISGFMVSGSFLARSNLSSYLIARLLRIVPAFLCILLVSALVLGPLFTSLGMPEYFRAPEVRQYVVKNLHFSSDMAWTLPGVFQGNRTTTINGSLWTLPAEMRMYLLVAALGVFGMLRNRLLGTVAIAALLVAGLVDPQLLPVHSDWMRLGAFFCIGILAQLYKERIPVRHDVMLTLMALTYISYNTQSYLWLLGLSIGYFCFWFAYRTRPVPLGRFGDPSYGIYLWGWPVQQMVVATFPDITPLGDFLLSAPIAVVLGYLSWHLVESPALSLKGRLDAILKHPSVTRFFPEKGVQDR